MKFICSTSLLNQAIMNVSLAVAPKSSLAALEGILVTAKGQTVRLVGYNLELGITTTLEAQVREEGEVVIPAKLFSDIVRRTDSPEITISCDPRFLVEITGGVSRFTILGMSSLEFPELPSVGDGDGVSLPQNKLRSMIDQTLFAVSTSDAKPVHTGALFLMEDGEVTVVAVDGFRLALRREKAASNQPMRFIVPGRTLSELLKLLGDSDDSVGMQVSRKHILFTIGDCCVISRLLEGDFLDYNAAIPKESATVVKVNTRALINSIERTSLLISDRLKSPLRVSFGENVIQMSCSTTIGKAYDECPCETAGPGVEMGFNNRYLMDALKNSGSDQVLLQLGGPLSPMKVVPPDGDSFLFLVLPMRLKTE
ncbi:DNA polymerase III subunit beta [Angelakisella massiliensis]|uniref:DNA polymerase III subunit beta n=1 Tax=Angelakisella massiliensis TaxID=1871018 RepID=UPI0008F83188|nr:DNA polymerase III subunit beta [Angelakisella massiliensis]